MLKIVLLRIRITSSVLIFTFWFLAPLCEPVDAKTHIVHTVSEIQNALDEAAEEHHTNDPPDSHFILIAPGEYLLNHPLTYKADNCVGHFSILGISTAKGLVPVINGQHRTQLLNIARRFCGDIDVQNLILKNGYTTENGGAIAIFAEDGTVRLFNLRFEDNFSASKGGGAYINVLLGQVSLFNNIFFGNSTSGRGGGVCIEPERRGVRPEGAALYVHNNTFVNNNANSGGALAVNNRHAGLRRIETNIFWRNQADDGSDDLNLSSTVPQGWHIHNNIMSRTGRLINGRQVGPTHISPEPGQYDLSAVVNFAEDPMLDSEFIPLAGSPVIDTGPPREDMLFYYPPQIFDYLGRQRNIDGNADGIAIIDRGAIEFWP